MRLALNLKVDNADEKDVNAFTFLLRHLTHGDRAMATLLKTGKVEVSVTELSHDLNGRESFELGRTVTVTATKEGR